MMLRARGWEVSGLALDPEPGSLFEVADVGSLMTQDHRVDIRDAAGAQSAVRSIAPDAVFHMAAQPLVRESYLECAVHENLDDDGIPSYSCSEGCRSLDL